MISDFAAALAFLTRIPIARRAAFDARRVARSARWFPVVGALLGAASAGALRIGGAVFPPLLMSVLLVLLGTALTGALHLDGLADTADGFGGGATREAVLRIMRDHAIGSYGGVALVLDIALKIAAVAALIERHRAVAALIVAPALGRWAAVLLSATQPYARPDGGSPAHFVGRAEAIISTILAIAVAVPLDLWRGPIAVASCALAAAVWGWCCRRRIGGVTGDTLGAGIEMAECLVLVLFAAIAA